MTIQDVHTLINMRIDEINSHVRDGFLPEELDIYINLAITSFINEQVAYIRDNKDLRNDELLYKGRSVTENLQTLIVTNILPLNLIQQDEYEAIVPNDYFKYLDSFVYSANNVRHESNFLELTSYNKYKTVVNNFPLYDGLPITLIGNKLRLLSNRVSISNCELYYIKQFTKVDFSTNVTIPLEESTHKDIVELTVKLILGDLNLSTERPNK